MSDEEIMVKIVEQADNSDFKRPNYQPLMVPADLAARDSCGDGTFEFKYLDPKIRWSESDFPIGVFIDKTNSDVRDCVDCIVESTQEALDEWQSRFGGDKQMYKIVENESDAKITIGWQQLDGGGRTVAICYYWFRDGNITRNRIQFDTSENWTVMDREVCGSFGDAFDYQSVLVHELGHGVGFAHNNDPLSCMFPSVKFGSTLGRTLSLGDEKGFKELYEIPDTPTPPPPPPPPPEPVNNPPVAKGMSLEMDQGDEILIHLDATDPDDDKLTYEITKQPKNGAFALDPATGHIQYRPRDDFVGMESFSYMVTDEHGAESNVADVVIVVNEADGEEEVYEIKIEVPADPTPEDVNNAYIEFASELDKIVSNE